MDEFIKNFITDSLDLKEEKDYEFKEIYGFTFVFKRSIISFNERISSGEIRPAGIIYRQHGEIYFAPIDEDAEIEEIVSELFRKGNVFT